jgi:hypothetical protein
MLLALLGGVVGLAIGHAMDVRIARRRSRMLAQAGRLLDRG